MLFTRNRWPAASRDGIHPFPHFHSNSHEVLGIYSGQVVVEFSVEGALEVIGAYPEGSQPDTCMPPFAGGARHAAAVGAVPLLDMDPVFGPGGPLFELWR